MPTPPEGIQLDFELTSRCNRSCIHCFRLPPQVPIDLPVELFCSALDQAPALGVRRIAFSGGEPTLHPAFSQILLETARRGLTYHIVTNGVRFAQTYAAMERAGIASAAGVSLSLEAADEQTHDAIRGGGSFREVMAATAVCTRARLPFVFQTTMHRGNAEHIRETVLLAAELGAARMFLVHLQVTERAVAAGLVPSTQERLEYERVVRGLAQMLTMPVHLSTGHSTNDPLFPCRTFALRELNIRYDGSLSFCCQVADTGPTVPPSADTICSLATTPLVEGCIRLARRVAQVQEARLRDTAGGDDQGRFFPCDWCLRYFGKAVKGAAR